MHHILKYNDYITEHKKFKELKNSNKSIIFKKEDLLQLAYYIINVLPKDAIKELFNWDIIAKSPWSYSFYNTEDLSWTHKELGTLTKSGGDRFVIDNDLTLRKYTGHINYKPFTIEHIKIMN